MKYILLAIAISFLGLEVISMSIDRETAIEVARTIERAESYRLISVARSWDERKDCADTNDAKRSQFWLRFYSSTEGNHVLIRVCCTRDNIFQVTCGEIR